MVVRPRRLEALLLVAYAGALPVAYEVFRMGYFAELGPNTALAKEAGTAFWSQGWHYLGDFVWPYALWLPLAALSAVAGLELARKAPRNVLVPAAAAVSGALLQALYVVRLGGDFMHARLLLPSLFGLLLPVAVVVPRTRTAWLLAAAVVAWAVVCTVGLRPTYAGTDRLSSGIGDERARWNLIAGTPHPITLADWSSSSLVRDGLALRRLAERRGVRAMVLTPPGAGLIDPALPNIPPKPDLPSRVLGTFSTVGKASYAAGPRVQVVDRLGLGDALAARIRVEPGPGPGGTLVAHPRRIGHEKFLPVEWVIALYGDPARQPPLPEDVAARVDAARKALRCDDLEKVVAATELPMTAHRFLANLRLAVTLNGLRLPSDPTLAERAFCGER
jgi:arabinofuranosyltransferase